MNHCTRSYRIIILPEVNPETRTVRFLAVIPAKDGLFTVFVPKDAVIRTGEGDIVFAKEGELCLRG